MAEAFCLAISGPHEGPFSGIQYESVFHLTWLGRERFHVLTDRCAGAEHRETHSYGTAEWGGEGVGAGWNPLTFNIDTHGTLELGSEWRNTLAKGPFCGMAASW